MYTGNYIPSNVRCEIELNSPPNEQSKEALISISWHIDQSIVLELRRFDIFCNCTVFGPHNFKVCACVVYAIVIVIKC